MAVWAIIQDKMIVNMVLDYWKVTSFQDGVKDKKIL